MVNKFKILKKIKFIFLKFKYIMVNYFKKFIYINIIKIKK